VIQAIQVLIDNGSLSVEIPPVKIDRTRDKTHGDFAANAAMMLAKAARKNPREIASMIVAALPENDFLSRLFPA